MTTEDFDPMFDEIGSKLKIKEIQQTKEELLRSLELYYKVFFLEKKFNVIGYRCWKYKYYTGCI